MHIEEISDEVAERLKVSQTEGEGQEEKVETAQSSPPAPSTAQDGATTASAAMFPELSPGRAMTNKKTVDEVVAELKKTPFFMTELEENDDTEAFKALAYEGTPLEVASDFKDHGNECFRVKRWSDAKEFYTKGVLVLAAEERKRAKGIEQGVAPQAEEKKTAKEDGKEKEEDDPQSQRAMLESLYVNRAACHLELKNYRSCWLDCSAALRLNDTNIKAYYRSARAFLAVGRIEEADDACARGLALDENNNPLKSIARDIIKKSEEVAAKQRKENERLMREKRREMLLKAALKARGIKTRTTAQPPEMEDAGLRLVPDPDDPHSTLNFPAVLLYPAHLESDFIKAFGETETLADHLAYVFPLPWDKSKEYTAAGVECYMETLGGGLVKVGKKASLLKTLSSGNVEVVDEVVRFFVLPKAKAAAWVQEFKMKKAAEKGSG
ncbi:TPR-like protein [Hypoxylon trugodes]|uniref:TPR-like protein n=1 Tax=Hypoxylon trugodes TaxID=326681 RepID=UPI0021A0F6D2|nr:TPR-like protein [Hypoxylon trugodes]KAI1394058.1 TPR-like protein [Hypoxylon trugodes]